MPDKNSPEFITFIRGVLKNFGRMRQRDIDTITSEQHQHVWRTAFTTKYEHPDENYELYELFGDEALDCALLHYIRKRYPQLSVRGMLTATIARIKINYLDVGTFSRFSQMYGFSQWVNLPDVDSLSQNEQNKYRNKHGADGIYEDVLEAFFGAAERLIDDFIMDGLSTVVIRNMFAYMYNNIDNGQLINFRYTSLFDAKTRLKQAVDYIYQRDFGNAPAPSNRQTAVFYRMDETSEVPSVTVSVAFPSEMGGNVNPSKKYTLATVSTGERQKIIEKKAAEIGLQVLAESGYSIPNPPAINTEIERLFGYIDDDEYAEYFVASDDPVATIPSRDQVLGLRPVRQPQPQRRPDRRTDRPAVDRAPPGGLVSFQRQETQTQTHTRDRAPRRATPPTRKAAGVAATAATPKAAATATGSPQSKLNEKRRKMLEKFKKTTKK